MFPLRDYKKPAGIERYDALPAAWSVQVPLRSMSPFIADEREERCEGNYAIRILPIFLLLNMFSCLSLEDSLYARVASLLIEMREGKPVGF